MSVTFEDRSAAFLRRWDAAQRAGLTAAGNVVRRAVTRAHDSTYYKGGAFRGTLFVRQSIRQSDPERGPDGALSVVVGTKIREALFWELGHHNLFTRRYERRELWVPAARAAAQEASRAYGRTVARFLKQED